MRDGVYILFGDHYKKLSTPFLQIGESGSRGYHFGNRVWPCPTSSMYDCGWFLDDHMKKSAVFHHLATLLYMGEVI